MIDSLLLTPFEVEALTLSLWVSGWAVFASLPPGIACAWLLARCRFPGKSLIDGLIHLPLVLPPVVVGYALLVTFGRRGMVGAWLYDTFGFTFAFNWKGAALASAVIAFPLLVRAVRLSLDSIDKGLEDAARTLGAGPVRVFFTITLPLSARAVFAGMTLMFARSLGEFGATIILAGNIPGRTQTIPLAIYDYTSTPGGDRMALMLCLVSILLSFVVLLASGAASRSLDRK